MEKNSAVAQRGTPGAWADAIQSERVSVQQEHITPMPPTIVKLWLPDRPVPKQSARFGQGKVFRDPRVEHNEELIGAMAWEERERQGILRPYLGPIEVNYIFCLGFPSAALAETRNDGYHVDAIDRPDGENLEKLVNDALKGVRGLFFDDDQIVVVTRKKLYAPIHGVRVVVHLHDPRNPLQWKQQVVRYRKALDDMNPRDKKSLQEFRERFKFKSVGLRLPRDSEE